MQRQGLTHPIAPSPRDYVRTYSPIYAVASPCSLTVIGDKGDSSSRIKSDPEASQLLGKVWRETQADYIKARDAGARRAWCRVFVANNSDHVKFKSTIAELMTLGANTKVQAAVAHEVCELNDPVKLSKADKKSFDDIKKQWKYEFEGAKEAAIGKKMDVADCGSQRAVLRRAGKQMK
jgi:hypothetical protein